MSFHDLVLRRELGRLVAAVMDYYNGDHQGNDSEALEVLRKKAYEAHQNASLHGHPQLSVNVLCAEDVDYIFPYLKHSSRPKPWMEKRENIPGFKFYTLRAHPERSSAIIRLQLDVLLEYVLSHVQPEEPHVRLESEVAYVIQPITYKGDTYRLYGRPDYILRYNDQDQLSVKLLVVRAKRLGFQYCSGNSRFSCCNPVQLLALMAMFHRHRKTSGETDCAVYGVATDSIDFWFYHIDNNSEVSSVRLSAKARPRFIDYQEITGLLGHIFTEAVNSSPKKTKLRSNDTRQVQFADEPQHANKEED